VLAADVRQFILQEAQHHKNHAKVNRIIHAQLGPAVAAELSALEDRLDRDYHRYNETKSAKFNAVYAEGFEAMTCAMVMSTFERTAQQAGSPGRFGPWQQLYAWHGAEEIEHRTVAFGVYDTLFGGYLYRVYGSLRAQIHFGLYVARLQRVLLVAHGQPRKLHMPSWWKTARSHYLRTFRRGYDPADLQPDPVVQLVLSMYTPADPA
jgi:predicted metal-dependent hydrolase